MMVIALQVLPGLAGSAGADGVSGQNGPEGGRAAEPAHLPTDAHYQVVLKTPACGPLPGKEKSWGGYPRKDAGTKGIVSVPDVPAYRWRHGCGPTAAGMIIGYWDVRGFTDLVPGEADSQTTEVDQMIASGEHYTDYSLPKDDEDTGIRDDKSTLGGAHDPHNCVADWVHTSWSSDGLYYGWSYFSRLDNGIEEYCAARGYSGFTVWNEYWGTFDWNDYMGEIDAGRPVGLLVDTDANGMTDHFVVGVAYDTSEQRYGCHNTWDDSVHWYDFEEMASGQPWGIRGVTLVHAPPLPLKVIRWEVLADHGPAGSLATEIPDGGCEPRRSGLQRLRITFNTEVDPATVGPGAVTLVGGAVGDQSSLIESLGLDPSGKQLTVVLSGPVPDGDVYTVTVAGQVADSDGEPLTGDPDLQLSVLLGDVDGSGIVERSDMLAVRAVGGDPIDGTNAPLDVNNSGAVTGSDLLAVRSRLGSSLP